MHRFTEVTATHFDRERPSWQDDDTGQSPAWDMETCFYIFQGFLVEETFCDISYE